MRPCGKFRIGDLVLSVLTAVFWAAVLAELFNFCVTSLCGLFIWWLFLFFMAVFVVGAGLINGAASAMDMPFPLNETNLGGFALFCLLVAACIAFICVRREYRRGV